MFENMRTKAVVRQVVKRFEEGGLDVVTERTTEDSPIENTWAKREGGEEDKNAALITTINTDNNAECTLHAEGTEEGISEVVDGSMEIIKVAIGMALSDIYGALSHGDPKGLADAMEIPKEEALEIFKYCHGIKDIIKSVFGDELEQSISEIANGSMDGSLAAMELIVMMAEKGGATLY